MIRFLLCFCLCVNIGWTARNDTKVKVGLYYESLCPDSFDFYVNQFVYAVADLEPHLTVYTNPYGKAKTYVDPNGTITFTCQHGPNECYGNMMHACAIKRLRGKAELYVKLNDCLFSFGHTVDNLKQCGKKLNIPTESILSCLGSSAARLYLKEFGEENLKPLNYVPTVTVNGKAYQSPANFKKILCDALDNKPPTCS